MNPILRFSSHMPGMLLVGLLAWVLCMSAPLRAAPATDRDDDGLPDAVEQALGTNPNSIDTDCDGYGDGTEVSDPINPADGDGDGLSDARESSIFDSNLNGVSDQTDPVLSVQLSCMRFSPFVLADDGQDDARLEIRVEGQPAIQSARIPPSAYFTVGLLYDGTPLTSDEGVLLNDRGIDGDQQANDHIWTAQGFSAGVQTPALQERGRKTFILSHISVEDVNATEHTFDLRDHRKSSPGIEIGVVSQHALAPADQLHPQVQVVSNLANIVDPEADLLAARESPDLSAAAQRFYAYFPDEYDFLAFYEDYDLYKTYSGYYYGVKNDVTNIGQSVFDRSYDYGSGGNLEGVMRFRFSAAPFAHEIMHRWGAPLLPSLGFNQCSANPPDAHWGVAGVQKGILGGYDPATLVDNGSGLYTAGLFFPVSSRVSIYNELERYLAGMIPASQVQPVQIPLSVDCASLAIDFIQETTTFRSQGLKTVTTAEIQQALGGERNPPFDRSQHSFTVASVVFSARPLTEAELAYFNVETQNQGDPAVYYSFATLTGGVGAVDTRMSDVSLIGIDAWVGAAESISAHAGQSVSIPVQVGNASARASGAVTLTLTLDSVLTYVTDTFGVTPTVASEDNTTTVRWRWPTLAAATNIEGIVTVTVPDASPGTVFDFTATVDTAADPQPANNAGSGQITVNTFVYLPGIRR